MNGEEGLYAMDDSELANLLYFEPERFDEVIEVLASEDEISRLGNIAELLREELVPEEELGDYQNNEKIREILSRIYEYGDAIYPEDDEIIEEYSDLDDAHELLIPEGMSQDEYYRILEEAEEEYLRIIDLEVDSKIEKYIIEGYTPEDILSKLEFEDGINLSPESIKDLYYKCGYGYNIENGVEEEHTAEEIKEGVSDLTQGEVGETLNVITDIGEPQKDPHSLE